MTANSTHPAESTSQLRGRVERLFSSVTQPSRRALRQQRVPKARQDYLGESIGDFVGFLSDAVPGGNLYVFGGVLRDLALFGRRGFHSDIDLVVEGDWSTLATYVEKLGAQRNKFGGYRLSLDEWPIDIWNARETWAIQRGLIEYKGIASLTETTVLNWDGILMNWRTRNFVHRRRYFEELRTRTLDLVLEENPNPRGMAVRVFRHLCLKDAKTITARLARYLARCANHYQFEEIRSAEIKSYGNSVIEKPVYRFFEVLDPSDAESLSHNWSVASDIIKREFDFE